MPVFQKHVSEALPAGSTVVFAVEPSGRASSVVSSRIVTV